MKVGSIGYATNQGLGILLKDFYDNGIVNNVITVIHHSRENHEWYNGPKLRIRGFDHRLFQEFVSHMDVMFFFETPFDLEIINFCRRNNVRTILMPMYECTPRMDPADLTLNPSLLDQEYYPEGKLCQVPIPRHIRWKQRDRAKVFVHNAGFLGLNGRNGTLELLEAMKYVRSPIKLIVRIQEPIKIFPETINDNRIEFRIGTFPKEALYEEGDVFIFPEKFNGLSLPLQEAKASGMLVMATNRFPINTWTSNAPLIQPVGKRQVKVASREITETIIDPIEIAKTIDLWYNQDITQYSLEGKRYLENNNWDVLKPRYLQEILSLVMQ